MEQPAGNQPPSQANASAPVREQASDPAKTAAAGASDAPLQAQASDSSMQPVGNVPVMSTGNQPPRDSNAQAPQGKQVPDSTNQPVADVAPSVGVAAPTD